MQGSRDFGPGIAELGDVIAQGFKVKFVLRRLFGNPLSPKRSLILWAQGSTTRLWNRSPKPRDSGKQGVSDLYSALRTPGKHERFPLPMSAESFVTDGILPFQLTCAKAGAVAPSADMLGLGGLPATRSPGENRSVNEARNSYMASLGQPDRILKMHPSHPSISTTRRKDIQFPAESNSSPPLILHPSTPAATIDAPSGSQVVQKSAKEKETVHDHAQRIDREINQNELRLSAVKALGYVPPHLRPTLQKTPCATEDVSENYIPPHLRKPRDQNRRTCSLNSAPGWGASGHGPDLIKPHEDSVVLTPISRLPERPANDFPSLVEVTKPLSFTTSQCLGLAPAEQLLYKDNPVTPGARRPASYANRKISQLDSQRERAVSLPPSSESGSRINTPYLPLRPETPPPPPPPSNNCRGGTSSFSYHDGYSSYHTTHGFSGERSFFGQNSVRDSNFMLDHVGARKLRSYTRYRSKPGFAPHHPRLPFEFLHRIYGQSGATYSETLGERLDSSSAIGPRSIPIPGKTYCHPSTPQRRVVADGLGNGYIIPKRQHFAGYKSTNSLSSGSMSPTIEEIDDLVFKSWPQPSKRIVDEKYYQARGVILSGLPDTPTLEHVSRVCMGTGRIEDIQMKKKRGMALVTFVEASTARRFYETTNSRGVSLVYNHQETNEVVRTRVHIDMNPKIIVIKDTLRQVVDTKNGSRVLEIVGWTRDILETIVGDLFEGAGVGYSDLLMRLTSRYCLVERVQSIDWVQNQEGHMEAKIIFAGIRDAMNVHDSLEEVPALEGCDIVFRSDLCETTPE